MRGLRQAPAREHPDYSLAWAVIVGSLPIVIVGLLARSRITGPLRSMWVVAAALLLWSVVMWLAETATRSWTGGKGARGVHGHPARRC